MRKLLLATVATLALAGCAGGKITPAEGALTGCEAFDSAMQIAVQLRTDGNLSEGQVAAITAVLPSAVAFCGPNPPDVGEDIKALAIGNAVAVVQAIIATAGQKAAH